MIQSLIKMQSWYSSVIALKDEKNPALVNQQCATSWPNGRFQRSFAQIAVLRYQVSHDGCDRWCQFPHQSQVGYSWNPGIQETATWRDLERLFPWFSRLSLLVLMLVTSYIGGVVIKSCGIGMSIPQKMLGMTIPHSYHVPCPWLRSRSKAATLTPSGTTQRKRQRSSVQSAITAAGASMAGRIWWFPALWKLRWEQQAATRIAARCSPKGIA